MGKTLDVGTFTNKDDLVVQVVRIGELIGVLTALDSETIPDDVDRTGIDLSILGVPIDGGKLDLPAVLFSNSLGKLQVEASVFAVVVLIAEGLEGLVETNHELAVFA